MTTLDHVSLVDGYGPNHTCFLMTRKRTFHRQVVTGLHRDHEPLYLATGAHTSLRPCPLIDPALFQL